MSVTDCVLFQVIALASRVSRAKSSSAERAWRSISL